MWVSFGLENVKFALHVLSGITFAGVGWLYTDAWLGKRRTTELVKFLGFYLLALSFFISAVKIDYNFATTSIITALQPLQLSLILKIIGYFLLIAGLLTDPFPQTTGLRAVVPITGAIIGSIGLPFLSGAVALLFLYRATYGKEQHLKPIAYSMILFSLYDLLSYRNFFAQTTNISLFSVTKPYSMLWTVQNIVLLVATCILGRWVWFYLLKRFQSQLYAIYSISVVVIFLVITVCFTGLLLSHVQNQTLATLRSSIQMFSYVLENKKTDVVAKAQLLAESPVVRDAVDAGSRSKIITGINATTNLVATNTVLITNAQGQTLFRSDGREGAQDFFSNDPLIKRALDGRKAASLIEKEGALSPDLMVWGAVPVYKNSTIIGALVVGEVLDSAFLDGVKKNTNYEILLYGGHQLAATTITNEYGRSRPIGSVLDDQRIKQEVIQKQQLFSGDVVFFDSPYLGVYAPLNDVDGQTIGILGFLFPQLTVLQAAGSSIEYTFLLTIVVLIISGIPAFFIARHLSSQVS